MKWLAWFVIAVEVIWAMVAPHRIGRERKPLDATDYSLGLLGAGLMVAVCGRVLGWW